MYKVMVVDDEPIIRTGIRACLDWQALGLEMVGEYANGEEAYRAMTSVRPDILITDIKMPLMDGIELTGKAMALIPTIKVVFVSSYNDFEFVREGIRLGAVDYILKPTLEPSQLEALMKRCMEMLDREKEQSRHLLLAERQAEEAKRRTWERETKRLLLGEAETSPSGDLPDWMTGPVLYACILLDDCHEYDETNGFMHKTIVLEELRDALYARLAPCVALVADQSELFLMLPQTEDAVSRLETFKRQAEKRSGLSLTIGVHSGINSRGADVPLAERFRLARRAGARRFFSGTGLLHVCEKEPGKASEEAPEELPSLPPDRPADAQGVRRLLESRLALWRSGRYGEEAVKADACRILTALGRGRMDEWVQLYGMDRLHRAETVGQLHAALLQLAEEWMEKPAVPADSGISSAIEQAVRYIHAHYTDELTLQEVADQVHISKNYFSHLFKKQTGRNFIDYLIHLRIEHARTLLADTDLRVYEVAERSGFRDVKYFSKLFRRLTGATPQEYRANAGKGDGR